MKQEIKDEWLRRLRSGEIRQGQCLLHRRTGQQCCLGVLTEMAHEAGVVHRAASPVDPRAYMYADDGIAHHGSLPEGVRVWAGLPNNFNGLGYRPNNSEALALLNDSGTSFAEIADIIEREF